MMRRLSVVILSVAAVLALGHALAWAETIFASDFQDGKTSGWKAVGEGDVRLNSYAENISLQLGANAAAVAQVSTLGYAHVTLGVSFAARSLGSSDACIADVSADRGHNWTELFRVVHGQDDGVTLHAGGGALPLMDNQPALVLRLRNVAAGKGATCWADNIALTGDSAEAVALRPAFSATGARLALTYSELTGDQVVPGPVTLDGFAPPASATPPTNLFAGRLSLHVERAGSSLRVLKDQFGDADTGQGAARHLPPFDFAFVQSGEALIPVRRGAIPSTHPAWEFILEPGRVWNEAGDRGLTRAAIPFSLEERNANCMHNGVLTFLFGNGGFVSDVAYEIAQETCFYFKFDMWGRMTASVVPGAVENAAAIASAYAEELARRLPVRPIAQLAADFPGAVPVNFGSPDEIPQADMTLYGVVFHGVNYVSDCATRFGLSPYCAVTDLPSYSLAKSIVGGLATMRMATLYPETRHRSVAALVPECAAAGTWNDVTLANLLDMASGHFNSAADQADEGADDLSQFFLADTHAQRIAFACAHYPRQASPGTLWVYHTSDAYLLGTALNAFYRARSVNGGDFFNGLLAGTIWKKLALSPAADVTRRTYDAAAEPFTGYGMTLERDDVAKIADFVNVDRGETGGEQLVDAAMLDDALQRNPADPGLRAGGDDYRYHYGFWAWNAEHYLGCKKPAWIPFMSGYGGIAVALMPNGLTYYYFSDSGVWRWAKAAAEADRIKPFCAQ